MIAYWTGCVLSVAIAWLGIRIKQKILPDKWYKALVIVLSALPLILIAALRYDVGQDYLYTYVPYFERVNSGFPYEKLEPLYDLINKVVSKFSDDYVWVFAICAVIFMLFVYSQIFYDSPNICLSIFLLVGMSYYFIFLNGMRQMVGAAILFFSLRFLKGRKTIPFLLCVVAAACFHTSCLVFVFVYLLMYVDFTPKAVVIVTAILLVLSKPIAVVVNWIVQKTQYSNYIDSTYNTNQQGYVVLAMNIIIFALATVFYSKDITYQIYYKLQVCALWISSLSGEVVLINRIRWFFGLPGIILIPLAIENIKNKKLKAFIMVAVVILYFAYISYTIGIENGNNVLPYQTIFSR